MSKFTKYKLHHLFPRDDAEWHVAILSFLFLVIGMGNIFTTVWTITAKIRDRQMGYFKLRFTRLDKYFWTHKRRGPESRIVKVSLDLCRNVKFIVPININF